LVKQGYRVLHFTGSEVVANPHKVAFEALEMLGVYSGSFREFDPADPLGMGE
jgi:very-short-patch-repair endonuclease